MPFRKIPPFWLYSGKNYLHDTYLFALSPLPAAEPGCQSDPRQECLEGTLRSESEIGASTLRPEMPLQQA